MPLESGHKVTIWSIEDKGKFAKASLSGQKKDKDGKYITDWSNPFCTLFGKAYEEVKGHEFSKDDNKHITAKIGWGYEYDYESSDGKKYTRKQAPFSVSNNYDKAKGKQYTNYAIYDMTLVKSNQADNDEEVVDDTPAVDNTGASDQNVSETKPESQNGFVGLDFLNIPDGFNSQLPFK